VKIPKYLLMADGEPESELERHVQQLFMLAKALVSEIETLRAELSNDREGGRQIYFDSNGIDFYNEVERYEIELIRSALSYCHGNQTSAARLLHMKSTTLNAKMKHYGLNPVRSIMLEPVRAQTK
jgi:DNA-binding NtrC family response regulator